MTVTDARDQPVHSSVNSIEGVGRPTLALLIPAYNAAAFLPRLLDSAALQEEPFDQIWVYDDCSTDDTASVARRHGAQVISGTVNKGCSAGKNILAAHVDADYLHFHDADDALMPNFVTLARRWIEQGAPDVVLFPYEYRDHDTGELLSVRRFDPERVSRDARAYAILEQISPFCGMYRRSAYLAAGGYDEDPAVLYNEDVAFHIRMAFAGLSFGAETDVSIINYRRVGSMSNANALKCAEAHLAVMRKTLRHPESQRYGSEISRRLWLLSGSLGAHRSWTSADETVRLAASLAPPSRESGRRWFRLLARLAPTFAIRLREAAIRAFKPALRGR